MSQAQFFDLSSGSGSFILQFGAQAMGLSGVAVFVGPNGSNPNEANMQSPMSKACTITGLIGHLTGVSQVVTATLRKNGVSQAITAATSGGGSTLQDFAHSVSFAVGDLWSLVLTDTANDTVFANFQLLGVF